MKKYVSIFLLTFLCICVSSCSMNNVQKTEAEDITTTSTSQEVSADSSTAKAGQTLYWLIPDYGEYVKNTERYLNQMLSEDGYDFSVVFDTYDNTEQKDIETMVLSGKYDIFSIGTHSGNPYYEPSVLLKKGIALDLTEYLSSEEGQSLWTRFPEEIWKKHSFDGRYECIPNEATNYGIRYAVYNPSCFSEDESQEAGGDLQAILALLLSKQEDEACVPSYASISPNIVAAYRNAEIFDGLFVTSEGREVYNPLQDEENLKIISLLEQAYHAGILVVQREDELVKAEESREFGVIIGCRSDDYINEKFSDIIMEPLYFHLQSSVSGATAVYKGSARSDKALQLLTLLHTSPEYANVLIYGIENRDYKIINDYAFSIEGEELYRYPAEVATGLYLNVIPATGDFMPFNRKEIRDNLFQSDRYQEYGLDGFIPDLSNAECNIFGISSLINFCFDVNSREYIDEYAGIKIVKNEDTQFWISQVEESLKQYGIELMISTLQEQIDAE